MITLHRPGNVDDESRFSQIVAAFEQITEEMKLVFPIHPRAKNNIKGTSLEKRIDGVPVKSIKRVRNICAPVTYLSQLFLQNSPRISIIALIYTYIYCEDDISTIDRYMKRLVVILIVSTVIVEVNTLSANDHIKKNFILTTTPDWIVDANATNNGLTNSCETANYIWGHGRTSRIVWKKSKISGDWTSVYDCGSASAVFSDGNQTLVVFNISGCAGAGKYSTDEGQTWNTILQMPDFNPYYYVIDGWHFASHNGIFILGEYLAAGKNPPRLFRSTDNGATWSTVYTEYNVDGKCNSHIHCVSYHDGLDAFVAVLGDCVSNRVYLRSDSNGSNWMRLMHGRGSQAVQLIDYGHPTRILTGSDTKEGLCSTDLVAETAYNVLNDRLTVSEIIQDGMIFSARKSDGIYYAFSYYEGSSKVSFGGVRWPKCFVSYDGENWTTYHQMPSSSALSGVRYISGTAQGYLHVTVNNGDWTYTCWKLKKPTLSNPRTGILIQANAANLLDTPDKSYFATAASTQFWDENGINSMLTFESSGGLFGPHCLKISKDAGLAGYTSTSPHDSPPALQYARDGRRVYGRAWVRGITNNADVAFSFSNNRNQLLNNDLLHTWTRWHFNDADRWMEILTASPGDSALDNEANAGYLLFKTAVSGSDIIGANDSATIYIGGAVASYAPINFLDAEPVYPDISYDYQTTAGAFWTTYMTIIPDVPFHTVRYYWIPWINGYVFDINDYCTHHAGQAGEGRIYKSAINNNSSEPPQNWIDETNDVSKQPHWHIKTWDDAQGNKLVLYLDCMPSYMPSYLGVPIEIQGRKLKLDIYTNGILRQTLESTPFAWDRQSQWQIAVSAGTDIKLFVQHSSRTIPELIDSTDAAITAALENGAFKNRTINHHYGDTQDMQSFTFYVIPDENKEKSFVPDTAEACRAEMDMIEGYDNPITQQPQNLTVLEGTNATFSVGGASDCGALSYQWKKNDVNVGVDSNVLTLYDIQPSDNGSKITCKVSNSCGTAITNPVLLTVTSLITHQPESVTVCKSSDVKFSINISPDCGTIHYQWKKNGQNVGTDNFMLILYGVQLNDDGSEITCEVNNSCGSAVSNPAILNVVPLITKQPQNAAVREYDTAAIFTIDTASGAGPCHYQWKKNGVNVGTDYWILTLDTVLNSDNGSVITCDVNNLRESETSNSAILNTTQIVMASSANSGSISPDGEVTVIHGNSQTFTAASPSYQRAQWFVDGNPADRNTWTFTLNNIQTDRTVYVDFYNPIYLSEGMELCIEDWLQTDSSADIAPEPDSDGIVNFLDFAAFAQY